MALAVQPELLSSVLARLLRSRGCHVVDIRNATSAKVDALVLSAGIVDLESDIAGIRRGMTVLLPDTSGRGGHVRSPHGSAEVLHHGELESLLHVLFPGR